MSVENDAIAPASTSGVRSMMLRLITCFRPANVMEDRPRCGVIAPRILTGADLKVPQRALRLEGGKS
jgi:hypothetical protein